MRPCMHACRAHEIDARCDPGDDSVAESTTEAVLWVLNHGFVFLLRSVGKYFYHNSVTAVQDAVMNMWSDLELTSHIILEQQQLSTH